MNVALVVTQSFADYAKGERITDADEVQRVLDEHPEMVTQISAPDLPDPEPNQSEFASHTAIQAPASAKE